MGSLGSWHRTPATIHCYGVAGQSASSSPKQSGHRLPTCNFDRTILPKIHWRGSYQSHSLGHSSNTLNRHRYASTNHIQRSLVLVSSFNFERVIFQFKWQSKVLSCSLSHCPLLVLALDADTEVMETQSNSLSSE